MWRWIDRSVGAKRMQDQLLGPGHLRCLGRVFSRWRLVVQVEARIEAAGGMRLVADVSRINRASYEFMYVLYEAVEHSVNIRVGSDWLRSPHPLQVSSL